MVVKIPKVWCGDRGYLKNSLGMFPAIAAQAYVNIDPHRSTS